MSETIESEMIKYNKLLRTLLEDITLPYQVTQLDNIALGALERKFEELSEENKAKVVKIAEEIFDSEMPSVVKNGRWYYCLMYGVVEFLQEEQG